MAEKKITQREMQNRIRNYAIEKMGDASIFAAGLVVGPSGERALMVPGEAVGVPNKDFWVTVKLVVRAFTDTETRAAYDGFEAADQWKEETELKAAEEKQKEEEKARKKRLSDAKRAAKKTPSEKAAE